MPNFGARNFDTKLENRLAYPAKIFRSWNRDNLRGYLPFNLPFTISPEDNFLNSDCFIENNKPPKSRP